MDNLEKATFAAGCFWGVQHYFDQVPGVIKTTAGYIGGHKENPTYEEVCSHKTGHAEGVEIKYDPELVSYETLVKHFFRIHDPTQLNRQGPDIGDNYRSAIFFYNDDQRKVAEAVRYDTQKNLNEPVVTDISPAQKFYPAEDYHQKYTAKTGHGMCRVGYQPLP